MEVKFPTLSCCTGSVSLLPRTDVRSKSETYGAAHVSQGLLSSAHSLLPHADGKRSHNVTAEFHRDATALQQSAGDE